MIRYIKKLRTKIWTVWSLRGVEHGINIHVNKKSSFTINTSIGNNCHFNGIKITGTGKVTIGDNFHSGGGLLILTSYHNYDTGKCIPYDDTYITKNVTIAENVWIGENVIILAGVNIGEGAVVQAGSVVVSNVPALSIVGGHPAQCFKMRDEKHYYKLKNEKKYF